MRKTLRRVVRIGAVVALLLVVFPMMNASAGTQTSTNACRNSATGTFTDLDSTTGGTATAQGGDVVLGNGTYVIDVPAAVLVAGYNLGLLTLGLNNIPGTVDVTINATNTAEGSQVLTEIPITGQTTISDPDGTPGNGDESATDLAVSTTFGDTTWTPTGGEIAFSAGSSKILASIFNGLIKVTFTCEIGLSTPPGCVTDPATDCTGFNPQNAAPFETFADQPPTTTTTTTTTTVPTTTTEPSTTTTTTGPTTSTSTTTTTAAPTTTTTTGPTTSTSTTTTTMAPTTTTMAPTTTTTIKHGTTTTIKHGTTTTVPGPCATTTVPGSNCTTTTSTTTTVPSSTSTSTTVPPSSTTSTSTTSTTSTTSSTTTSTTSTTTTTTAAPTTTTTVATQVQGNQQLAVTGPGLSVALAAGGFLLLDLGYLSLSAAMPGFRRRR